MLTPAWVIAITAWRSPGHGWRKRGGGDSAAGIFLMQVPLGARGKEEDEYREAHLPALCTTFSPQNLWEKQALLACFCFSSQTPSANISAGLICCEETHHSPTTGSIHCSVFLPSAAGFAVSLFLLAAGYLGAWMVSTCSSPHQLPSPHSLLLTLVCSLLYSFISPLSDMLPMEIQGTSGALPPQPKGGG